MATIPITGHSYPLILKNDPAIYHFEFGKLYRGLEKVHSDYGFILKTSDKITRLYKTTQYSEIYMGQLEAMSKRNHGGIGEGFITGSKEITGLLIADLHDVLRSLGLLRLP